MAEVTVDTVTYSVTIALTTPPSDVKSGMTAQTDVVVDFEDLSRGTAVGEVEERIPA